MSPPLRLLYAEDNPDDADLALAHFVRSAPDLRLEVIGSGMECLKHLGRETFDLLLLDNHLPDIDGIEVLTRLRAAGHRLPVVMLTGVGAEESVARALLAGADDYVTKAGDYLKRLPDLVRELMARLQDRSRGDLTPVRARRILYVEPNPDDAATTSRHFAAVAPYLELQITNNCRSALELLNERSGFDLVMTDLRIPDMSALDFFHEVTRRGIDLPFIVITGDGDEQTAVALLRLGASDYIVKRDNYLTQLPHSIDHALRRFQLDRTTRRLHADLERLNRTLEQRVEARTAELRREIQERKRAEEDLRASSDRYLRTLENMLEGCQILTPQWRYLYVNEAAARHSRKKKDDLVGRVMTEVFPGIKESPIFAGLQKCMTERTPVRLESAFTFEDGETAWFDLSIEPVPEGAFILSIEVTERRRVEEELRESEKNLDVTLQSIGDAVIATDSVGRVLRMNPTAERLTGWSFAEASGRPLQDVFRIVSAETGIPVTDPVQKVVAHGEIVGLANHTTLLARGGREYQIANTAAPIRDAAGRIRGVVLVFKDVTEEYRVQRLLRDREEQLSLIADALPGPVSRVSPDGHYLFANAAFARWFGRDLADIIGRTQEELLGTDRFERARPLIAKATAGERITYESAVPTAKDGVIHALVALIPDPDPRGGPSGHISVVTDLTDRKIAEEKLQKSEALRRIAGRTARLGGWALDLPGMNLTWTDEVCEIHEVPSGHAVDLDAALRFVAPEWKETASNAVYACLSDGSAFDHQMEIITASGRRLWVRSTGEAERNETGAIWRIQGALQDIDAHKRSERRISDQLAELLRWQQATVNRESRAQELKAEVNELLDRLKLPPRYGTPSEP